MLLRRDLVVYLYPYYPLLVSTCSRLVGPPAVMAHPFAGFFRFFWVWSTLRFPEKGVGVAAWRSLAQYSVLNLNRLNMFAIFTPHINSYHTISRLSFLGNSSNVDIVDFAAGCRMGFVSQVCPFELLRHCGLCAAGQLIVCSRLWAPLQEFLPKAGAFGYDDYNQVFSRFVDWCVYIILIYIYMYV